MTVAISLLVHGEAVRFNRGQSRGDDYDFKYMMGRDGKVYPYVSSQCFTRYWRGAFPGTSRPNNPTKGGSCNGGIPAIHSANPNHVLKMSPF